LSGRPRAASVCAWCANPLTPGSKRAPGGALCARCGSATTDPIPTDDELAAAYSSWYRPEGGRFGAVGDRILSRSRGLLAGRLDRAAPAGPVLDVGSGDGTLLAALRDHGREAVGVERESGVDGVIDADVRELDRPFAAIVFWHSLEHLRDAGAVLDHAASLLAAGGVLIVAMPNPASLQARAFGDRWLALDLPRHLVHVPAHALRQRIAERGLTVERVSYTRGGQVLFGWLHGLVGMVPGDPDLYDAIRRPEARRVAIGPGRRLMTLAAAVALAAPALVAACAEVAMRRGGTTYVEARRA